MNCFICSKSFWIHSCRKETAKTCSQKCYGKWRSINMSASNSTAWKGGQMVEHCIICSKEFKIDRYREKTAKFCSYTCVGLGRVGRIGWSKGKKRDEITGAKHWKWSGDNVGYHGVHDWISKEAGKANAHTCLQEDKTCKGPMNWSNKSGKYLRDRTDWWVLCQSHHMRYDRLNIWGAGIKFLTLNK